MAEARVKIIFKPSSESQIVHDSFETYFDQDDLSAFKVFLMLKKSLTTTVELLAEEGIDDVYRRQPSE